MAVAVLLVLLLGACAPRFQLPGPPRDEPRLTESHAVMADGAALPLRSWPVTGRAAGNHAGAPRVQRLRQFHRSGPPDHFGEAGVKVYAYDQRGFGNAPARGRWAGDPPP